LRADYWDSRQLLGWNDDKKAIDDDTQRDFRFRSLARFFIFLSSEKHQHKVSGGEKNSLIILSLPKLSRFSSTLFALVLPALLGAQREASRLASQ
jgi:hypothetical protein